MHLARAKFKRRMKEIFERKHFLFGEERCATLIGLLRIVESKTLGHPQNTGIVALFGALVQNLLRRFQILHFTVLGIPESVRLV